MTREDQGVREGMKGGYEGRMEEKKKEIKKLGGKRKEENERMKNKELVDEINERGRTVEG